MGHLITWVRKACFAAEAALYVSAAQLALAVVPAARAVGWLGRLRDPHAPAAASGRTAPAEAVRVGQAVERIAAILPWHPVCLPQAMAVRAMLLRRGLQCETHLGIVAGDTGRAHAWVTHDGVILQGATSEPATSLAAFS